MNNRTNSYDILIGLLVSFVPALRTHAGEQHAGDLIIGRDGSGKLKVEFDFSTASSLSPIASPIMGWISDEPGMEALVDDEPDEDFFTLASGNNIVFEVVSLDPAFKVYSPGFTQLLDSPGETWDMGPSPHDHANWFIDSTDAGYLNGQQFWDVTLRFRDTGSTGYTMSDTFTLRFTNIPEGVPTVSEWGLVVLILALMAAGTAVIRRRGNVHSAVAGRGSM